MFCPFRCPNVMISGSIVVTLLHYENTPIQIYRKFHLQKLIIFRQKNSDIFHISAQNIHCGTRLSRLAEVFLTSTHNLCF